MRTIATLTATLALSVAVVGCGSDNKNAGGKSSGSTSSSSGGGGQQIALAADPGGAKKFDKPSLDAKAGKVTINFDNPASLPHAVEIEGNGVEEVSDTVTGAKTSVTADLKPGKYDFYCPVGDHRAAGMEGTLTVK